jgi:hypothetical protein
VRHFGSEAAHATDGTNSCGFYPGSEPGEYLYGTAIDFDQARRDFEAAWRFCEAHRWRLSGLA